jgi:hypothetical protein
MLGNLYRFIVGNFHIHKWEVHSQSHAFYDAWERRPVRAIVLRCSHCGALKEKKMGA